MALVLGTNVGFVLVAPTADPAGSDTTIDGSSVVVKHTSPAEATKITEIGWYRGSGTNTANFEVALYSESAGVAATRLFVDNTNSSSASGWITVAVDWAISGNTAYWLGLQMDAHSGSSTIDSATSGGAGIDLLTSQTTLNNPYGGGAVSDADGMYAIYAKVNVNQIVLPGVGAASFTGFVPTVQTPRNMDAGLGAATIAGFSPTVAVTNNINVAAGLGELTAAGVSATVAVTNNLNVSPGVGQPVLAGFSPTIETPRNVSADFGQVSFAGFAPVVEVPRNILAGTGTPIFNGFSPSIEVPRNVTPGLGSALFSGFAPTIQVPVSVLVGFGQASLTGLPPTATTSDHKVVNPSTGLLTLTGFDPVVSIGSGGGPAVVEALTGEIVLVCYEPTASAGQSFDFSSPITITDIVDISSKITPRTEYNFNSSIS